MFRLLRPFEYFEPTSVRETVALLADFGDSARIMAGGTDLVISMKKREVNPDRIISIGGLGELEFLEVDEQGTLHLGPLVTHAEIARSPLVRENFEMLAAACNEVGTPQVRNMGTIGGNLCKAGPSQDTPPPLVALEARLRLIGPEGERIVPLDEFCTGSFCTILAQNELLVEILVPAMPPRSAGCYKWITKVTATDETLAGAGVVVVRDADGTCEEARIGLGSVSPIAIRAREAEAFLAGKELEPDVIREAGGLAAAECRPRSRADYRRHMVSVLVADALTELWPKTASLPESDR